MNKLRGITRHNGWNNCLDLIFDLHVSIIYLRALVQFLGRKKFQILQNYSYLRKYGYFTHKKSPKEPPVLLQLSVFITDNR